MPPRQHISDWTRAEGLTNFRLYLLGYAVYRLCTFIYFHSATLFAGSAALPGNGETVFLLAFACAQVLTLMLSIFLALKSERFFRSVPALFAGLAAVAGVVIASAAVLPAKDMAAFDPLLIAAAVCLGAGDALLMLLWGKFCSTFTLRGVYIYVLVSYGISLILYSLVAVLPAVSIVPLTVVLVGISALAAWCGIRDRTAVAEELTVPVAVGAFQLLWRPTLGASVFCFMSGLMFEISGRQGIPLATFQQTAILGSLVVVLILLFPAVFFSRPMMVSMAYRIALPISAAGFLLLPFIWNAYGGVANALPAMGSMIAGTILWCIVAETAHDTRLPAYLLFGATQGTALGATALGMLVGYFNAATIGDSDVTLFAVALTSIYLLAVFSLFLVRERRPAAEPEYVQVVVRDETWFRERCRQLGEAAGFTPREFEMLEYIAQGRSVPYISESLVVSENTVKSHIKSIYQKLGVHSKQELIDLVGASVARK